MRGVPPGPPSPRGLRPPHASLRPPELCALPRPGCGLLLQQLTTLLAQPELLSQHHAPSLNSSSMWLRPVQPLSPRTPSAQAAAPRPGGGLFCSRPGRLGCSRGAPTAPGGARAFESSRVPGARAPATLLSSECRSDWNSSVSWI